MDEERPDQPIAYGEGPFSGPIPHRGQFPLMSSDEPEDQQRELVCDGHAEVVNLSEQEGMETYQRVVKLVANGRAKFGHCEYQADEENNSWVVLLTWVEYYYETPDSAKQKKLNT